MSSAHITFTVKSLFQCLSLTQTFLATVSPPFFPSQTTFPLGNCSQNASPWRTKLQKLPKLGLYCATMATRNNFLKFHFEEVLCSALYCKRPGCERMTDPCRSRLASSRRVFDTSHFSSPWRGTALPGPTEVPYGPERLACMFSDTMGSFEWTGTVWKMFRKDLSVSQQNKKINKNEKERKNSHCLVWKNALSGTVRGIKSHWWRCLRLKCARLCVWTPHIQSKNRIIF